MDESQNIVSDETTEVIEPSSRGSDKQFLLQCALKLTKYNPGTKLVVQNKYKVEKFTSTVIRYVGVNGKLY